MAYKFLNTDQEIYIKKLIANQMPDPLPNEYWEPIRSKKNFCQYDEVVWHLANQWLQVSNTSNLSSKIWAIKGQENLDHPFRVLINNQQLELFALSNANLLKIATPEILRNYKDLVHRILMTFHAFNDYYLGVLYSKKIVDEYTANVLMLGMWYYLVFHEGNGFLIGELTNINTNNNLENLIKTESENYQDFFERTSLSIEHEDFFAKTLRLFDEIGLGPWSPEIYDFICNMNVPKVHDYDALMEARALKESDPKLYELISKAFSTK